MTFVCPTVNVLWDAFPPDNIRRWSLETSGANINDGNVAITKASVNEITGAIGSIVLTSIDVLYNSTTSGAGNIIYVKASHHPSTVPISPVAIYISTMTSTATLSYCQWQGSVIVDWSNPGIAANAAVIEVTNMAAGLKTNDDIWIWATGELHEPPKDRMWNEPQPVSLEGYKWPLTKRRA